MDTVGLSALVLAALEVAPAEPADLTRILCARDQLEALVTGSGRQGSWPLTRYLIDAIDAERVAHWHRRLHRDVHEGQLYRLLVAGRPGYPVRLASVWDAPPLLFVRGDLPDDRVPTVAIIGSRATDEQTLKATSELARSLAADGISVVSGLAQGVDGAAHRGALLAGHTTAVLGTGILDVYPDSHAALAGQIVTRGALVSQFPPSAPRTGTTFLMRNATIAAMSDVFIAMDAGERSGSRQALSRAVEYGRSCLVWRANLGRAPWVAQLAGADTVRFFDDASEVRTALHSVPA